MSAHNKHSDRIQVEVDGYIWRSSMTGCVHHWEIETADGPISKGRCLRCKKTREFENSINASTYNGRSKPGK